MPFASALILALIGGFMPRKSIGIIACLGTGLSALLGVITALEFFKLHTKAVDTTLYNWISTGGLNVDIALHLDGLSLVMMVVISFVAFLIHLYASQSMQDEEGYSRFMCYLNLFVGSMLVLILAKSLLLLYLGWEGVGVCSYLLIGFWYKEKKNGYAAQKAFIITRIGDTAMMVGLFIIYNLFNTLDIQNILQQAPSLLTNNSMAINAIAFLLIAGAIGKSAQIPLHTWLPDAMAGPIPVSALIHAATMVTAGVYLIARMNGIFVLVPAAMSAISIIGMVTLLVAGFSALVQKDLKRILAYSTMSQVGYMFVALGVGAWSGAIFHFMTHAFFKALLFLSAGIVIDAQNQEHDIFRMGGLRKKLPIAFWTFLIGASSLSALPFVTAGFYSKDAIIWSTYSSVNGSLWLSGAALLGSFVTGLYSFRALFVVFFGKQQMEVSKYPGILMILVVCVLAFLSLVGGFVQTPEVLFHVNIFENILRDVFPNMASTQQSALSAQKLLILISSFIVLFSIVIAYIYYKKRNIYAALVSSKACQGIHAFVFSGFGFDWLYKKTFVNLYVIIAKILHPEYIDKIFDGIAGITLLMNRGLSYTQTGKTRHYAMGIVIGTAVIAAFMIMAIR